MIESLSVRLTPSVPEPVPVEAVTVQIAPLPVTLLMDAPATPVAASVKSFASTPLTCSENVTVQDTDAAFVGELPLRASEDTVGAVVSLVTVTTSLVPA